MRIWAKTQRHRVASKLANYSDRPDVIVLALPRGGVPVGAEVARLLPPKPDPKKFMVLSLFCGSGYPDLRKVYFKL